MQGKILSDFETKLKNLYGLLRDNLIEQEIINLLLQYQNKYNINTPDKNGFTILHWAIQQHNRTIVTKLCALPNIDLNAQFPPHLATPFVFAAYKGNIEIINELLKYQDRMNINSQECHGKSALHFAVNINNIELVQRLIELPNFDQTLRDDNQKTAYDTAVEKKIVAISKLLKPKSQTGKKLEK